MGLFGKKKKANNDGIDLPQRIEYHGADPLLPGQGPCPSGRLTITHSNRPCPGFRCNGTIELEYVIPDGIQANFHPHPGVPFEGTERVAYLPNNPEGHELLDRYRLVWVLGQSLDVGFSAARQKDHQVRWRDCIPHKTSLMGGAFGFPDPNFLPQAHTALDTIGIPDATSCSRILPDTLSRAGGSHAATLLYAPAPVHYAPALATAPPKLAMFPPVVQTETVSCKYPFYRLGGGPQGTMVIQSSEQECPGFDGAKTIEIEYTIPSDIQDDIHESPGTRFDGTTRTAFLPNTQNGRDLLQRLKYAFFYGRTFRIGTSAASGLQHQTTWTTIPHKTSLYGGQFGFPDLQYIEKCQTALDALGVPKVDTSVIGVAATTALPANNTSLALPAPMSPPVGVAVPALNVSHISVADSTSLASQMSFPSPMAPPSNLMPAAPIPMDAIDIQAQAPCLSSAPPPPTAPPPPFAPTLPDPAKVYVPARASIHKSDTTSFGASSPDTSVADEPRPAAEVTEDLTQRRHADVLHLKLSMASENKPGVHNFTFHLVVDDVVQVSKELVNRFGLPQDDLLNICQSISGLASAARLQRAAIAAQASPSLATTT